MTDDRRPRGPRRSDLSDAPTGQIGPRASLTVEVAGRTDKGRVRPGNEDAFAVESPASARARMQGTLLLVSDGMGGHAAGEVASQLAIDTIQAAYYRTHGVPTGDAVRDAITQANATIYENAGRDPSRAGMGCTIVALVVQNGNLTVGHVGDSRAYLIRAGQARQLTHDHSWVAMQVAEGILTPEQAEHHPNRSVLMRALGRHASVEVDVGFERLQAGDVLVICSDGLTGLVHDEEIAAYAGRHAPAALAEELVGLANQRGAPDNVTVVAAAIGGGIAGSAAGTDTVVSNSPDAATTSILPQLDTPTPRFVPQLDTPTPKSVPPLDDSPTVREVHRPAAPDPRPSGTPIVVSRASTPVPPATRGHGRLLIGVLATLGLAGVLLLLTLFTRTENSPLSGAARPAEAPAAAPAPTTGAPVAAAPAVAGAPQATVTVPPPVATGLPIAATPEAGTAATPTPVPTRQPTSAPVQASGAQPAPTPTGVAGIARAIGQEIASQVPTIVASPPALTLPTVAPTATPTPVQRSDAGDSSSSAEAASPGDDPAMAADAPADGAAPDEMPPDMSAEAAPPEEEAPPPPAPARSSRLPPAAATAVAPYLRGR
jgi:serine/threonine protein phosphatase PrpC